MAIPSNAELKGEIKMNTERLKWILLAVFLILEG